MNKLKVDLFSDTNSEPSKEMRIFMCDAEVGNDVASEDPTVNLLVQKTCELLGKEAGIFLPTGTMANGVSLRALCERPGDIIAFAENAHAMEFAAGLPSGLIHATPLIIPSIRGIYTVEALHSKLHNKYGYNLPRPRVISIEQTTNFGGGAIWPLDNILEICQYAKENYLKVHMDGARLLNAVAATGISAAEYCKEVDAVWIDFCKILGAPMGAVLAGTQDFIDNAWYYKFQQGGGMHQAGILAAGCLYGLEHNFQRIPEVHKNTKYFAKRLGELSWIELNIDLVETNIVIFRINEPKINAKQIQNILLEKGIRVLAIDHEKIRAILHLDIGIKEIDYTISSLFECEDILLSKEYLN